MKQAALLWAALTLLLGRMAFLFQPLLPDEPVSGKTVSQMAAAPTLTSDPRIAEARSLWNAIEDRIQTSKTGEITLDVDYLSQEGTLPTGCETVSAAMVLNYWQQEAQRQQAQENWQAEMDFDREKWEASQAKAQSGGSSSGGSSRGSSSRSGSSAMTDSQAKAWAESYLSSGNTWAIGSAALEDWMARRGITGQAAETFLAALRQEGYGQRTGGGGKGGPEKNRVNMLN